MKVYLLSNWVEAGWGERNDPQTECVPPWWTPFSAQCSQQACNLNSLGFPLTHSLLQRQRTHNRRVFLHTADSLFHNFQDINTQIFFFRFISRRLSHSTWDLCDLRARRVWKQVSHSLPGNMFIFLDPSSSLRRGGVSPLLSPGPHGAL